MPRVALLDVAGVPLPRLLGAIAGVPSLIAGVTLLGAIDGCSGWHCWMLLGRHCRGCWVPSPF